MKLTLKLIETNETPKIGDLKKHWAGSLDVISDDFDIKLAKADIREKQCIIVTPYGISDEEYKIGDTVYSKAFDSVYPVKALPLSAKDAKKVVLLPEQFDYQEIVDLGLKDGDEFKVVCSQQYGDEELTIKIGEPVIMLFDNGKASISKSRLDMLDISAESKPYVDDRWNRISKPYRESLSEMYTEKEVLNLLEKYDREFKSDTMAYTNLAGAQYTVEDWFNKNKKK